MCIENSKNYTGFEDVYRNMSKERKLLKRALKYLCESRSDVAVDLYGEICDHLDDPVVAESASTEPVVGSKMEHTTEPVAFLYDLDAYCDHKPDENVLSKKLPKGLLARHIKNIRPLYTRPAPKREPLREEEIEVVAESAYVVVNENGNYMRVNPKREPMSDEEIVKLWANKSPANEFECVRLVEKFHGIGGEE